MRPELQRLIADYQMTVATKFQQLRDELGIEAPKTNTDWACNGITQNGVLSDGTQYFKHGYGCAIKYRDGSVDFDFGAQGELTGFNASRLWFFAESIDSNYNFSSEADLASAMNEAESRGELKYSGYILYYLNEPTA
jgi:Domain of unknown function (DUF6896)